MERQLLPRNTMPTPPDVSAIANAYWQPAITLVSGNQIYVLAHYDETPTEYTITFNNYDGTRLQRSQVTTYETPVYTGETPSRPSTTEYVYTFQGWSVDGSTVLAELPAATAAATYTALFTATARPYSIRFFQEDGTTQIGEMQTVTYGSMPSVPTYSKADPEEGHIYTLVWQPSVQTVTADADYRATFTDEVQRFSVTAVGSNCTFTSSGVYDYCATATHTLTAIPNEGYEFVKWQDEEGTVLATTANMSVAITANRTYTAVVRSAAMEVGLYESKTFSRPTTITDLVINASEEQSSDLNGLENLTITGHAYFDYYINAAAFTRQGQEWYAFGVPFPVVATDGIYKGATTTKLVLGTDIDIIYYDGAKRAQDGSENVNNWKYVEDLGNKTLQPGTLYMMAFARAYNGIVRFQMKADSQLDNSGSATVNEYTSDNAVDANWNGIANPALYKAYLNTGATIGQYRNSATGAWGTVDLTSVKFVVGRPVFVQVQNQQSVVVSRTAPSSAPLRRQAAALQSDRFDLQLLTPQGKTADRLFVIANDDAADTYTIGEDIAKAGVSTRVAQMWIDRYGARLCMNAIAATDNAALYPLTITAPAAGTYTLQAAPQNTEARLYLTYQGEVIADLTHQDFNLDLAKGTNSGYGLRLVTTRRDVVTDLDEVLGPNSTSDNEAGTEQTRKCIYRDQLYLIRGNQVFDAQGQRVQ